MPCFYVIPKQDDFNRELQICIAEALYDVDSIVADPGAYTREELSTLHSQILSNLEQAWELSGGSEEQLLSTMMQISQPLWRVVSRLHRRHSTTADSISPRSLGPVQRPICGFDDFSRRCNTGVALRHTYADRYSLATPA